MPRVRIERMRLASWGEIDGGRPSRTPCILLTASASRVRWPISRAVDRELIDAAASFPFVNQRSVALVSERVGNYQFHPLWGVLPDQLWVR